MPQREDDVRRIVAGGRARNLSDDQIRALVSRYDARAQPQATPPPDSATRGMMQQSTVAGDPPSARDVAVEKAQQFALGAPGSIPLVGGGGLIRAGQATPGVVTSLLKTIKPHAGKALRAAGETLEQPVVGGLLGAMEGVSRKGLTPSVLLDAAGGAAGGHVLGRLMKRVGGSPPNPANKGGTLRPRTPPPDALGPRGLEQILTEGRAPSAATIAPSSPSGGGFTVPPSQPNAGGRLGGRSTPQPSIEAQIESAISGARTPQAVDVGLSHPSGGGFTVPPNMSTRPSVTYSPKAEAALKASSRPDPMPGLESNELAALTKRYRELSRKLILTPDETREIATLKPRIEGSAREVGMTYPAAGSPRNAVRDGRTGEVMLNAGEMEREAIMRLMRSH